MSVTEFTSALKNRAISNWFKKEASGTEASRINNINVVTNPTKLYRNTEEVADKTAFILTKSTLLGMVKNFSPDLDDAQAATKAAELFNSLAVRAKGEKIPRRKIQIRTKGRGPDGSNIAVVTDEGIFFPKIGFSTITTVMNNLLGLKGSELSAYYEKGHVYGLATRLLERTQKRMEASVRGSLVGGYTDSPEETQKALNTLSSIYANIIDYYTRLDLDSANIKTTTIDNSVNIYGDYFKKVDRQGNIKYLVEMQLESANQKSAIEVREGLKYIRKLLNPNTATAGEATVTAQIDKLLGTYTLNGEVKNIVSDTKFREDLIKLRSSPNLVNIVAKGVADAIRGTTTVHEYKGKTGKLATKKKSITVGPDLSALKTMRAEIKKAKQDAKKALVAVKQVSAKLSKQTPVTFNLSELQVFLNQHLQDVISANMGDGNSRSILNYRTGRFAASVKVENLTESRQGMITAFYSYMKNPYATFSDTGRQSSPRTRDPKLLIARSIRELAAQKAVTRLRAVLI